MVPNKQQAKPRPEPKTVRDLRLAYDTCAKVDGNIEHKQLLGNEDYCEGAFVRMVMRVVPEIHRDVVRVVVEREKLTNYRKTSPIGCSYTPVKVIDWEREYTFDEFRESPFYDLTIDEWGKHWRTRWDTSDMDEHRIYDNGTEWWLYAHFYEHERDWLNNWRKSGKIRDADIRMDEDGDISIHMDGECLFDGYIGDLGNMLREHEEMTENMKKLKEHGIDLDDGTLSIKLWE